MMKGTSGMISINLTENPKKTKYENAISLNTRIYYILWNDALFLSHLKNSVVLFFDGLLLSYALHKEVVKTNTFTRLEMLWICKAI